MARAHGIYRNNPEVLEILSKAEKAVDPITGIRLLTQLVGGRPVEEYCVGRRCEDAPEDSPRHSWKPVRELWDGKIYYGTTYPAGLNMKSRSLLCKGLRKLLKENEIMVVHGFVIDHAPGDEGLVVPYFWLRKPKLSI